ncbi:MAG TPA: CAP domain-containing protein [Patescibacteria group bacterium]|nr:CAP domain-containing protein [Patescibacteria group bacterium]
MSKKHVKKLFLKYAPYGIIPEAMNRKRIKKLKPKHISHVFIYIFAVCLLITTILSLKLFLVLGINIKKVNAEKKYYITSSTLPPVSPVVLSPTPTTPPKPTPTPEVWGVAKQIDNHTWTMNVGQDKKMASAQEIFSALNNYRKQKGSGQLTWDNNLANFAQKRADTFASIKGLDGHAGFNSYFSNQDNLKGIGFWGVGENSSYGYEMEAVHLIEWVFAGDGPHDKNQLDPTWTHVGVGVNGTSVDLIFGKNKI